MTWNYDKSRHQIKKKRHDFANKGPYSQSYGFSCSHVQMWELDHKEGWVPKNWCFQTVVLGKTLESPLDSCVIKGVNPKGSKPWIFIGRTDVEALILWAPDGKSQLTGKDPDTGEGWRQEEKGATENETVGWHHWLNGHVFEQAPGAGGRWGSLPDMLQSVELQRTGPNLATGQQQQKACGPANSLFWRKGSVCGVLCCWAFATVRQCPM